MLLLSFVLKKTLNIGGLQWYDVHAKLNVNRSTGTKVSTVEHTAARHTQTGGQYGYRLSLLFILGEKVGYKWSSHFCLCVCTQQFTLLLLLSCLSIRWVDTTAQVLCLVTIPDVWKAYTKMGFRSGLPNSNGAGLETNLHTRFQFLMATAMKITVL